MKNSSGLGEIKNSKDHKNDSDEQVRRLRSSNLLSSDESDMNINDQFDNDDTVFNNPIKVNKKPPSLDKLSNSKTGNKKSNADIRLRSSLFSQNSFGIAPKNQEQNVRIFFVKNK